MSRCGTCSTVYTGTQVCDLFRPWDGFEGFRVCMDEAFNQRLSQEPFQAEQSTTRCARAAGHRGRRGACRARSPESVSDASVIDVMKLCKSVGVEAYTFGPFQEKNIHSNIDTRGACLFSIVGFFILRPLPRPSSFRSFSSKPTPAPSHPCTTPTAPPSGPGCAACRVDACVLFCFVLLLCQPPGVKRKGIVVGDADGEKGRSTA
jgi:hypothetical protein